MFYQFLERLGPLAHTGISLKTVKRILRITEKSFPKRIQTHYELFKRHCDSKWQRKDKQLFIWTVMKYLELEKRKYMDINELDWEQISSILNVPSVTLQAKWMGMLRITLKEAPWTPEEDALIKSISNKASWIEVALEFNRKNSKMRHAKQIRERWNNYLDPMLNKQPFTPEEQTVLLRLSLNGKRWSVIAKAIPGRTENQVKNTYNSLINGYRKAHPQSLDSEEIIVNNLLRQLHVNVQTQVMSPLQQQFLLNCYFAERLKSLAYLSQFSLSQQNQITQ